MSNSTKRHADNSGNRQTVKPVNSKKTANFSRHLSTGQIDQTHSLLHSERLSKFWLLEITHMYHACHVKRHFPSNKQTRCWYKLPKVTNQRVYQTLVYQNEVFKTMLTGSPVTPSFSTRSHLSPAAFSIVHTDREPGTGYFLVYVHAYCTSMTDFALWISV